MKRLLASLACLVFQACGPVTFADTPPQVINKTCSSNQFFNKIAPGPGNITCLQPTYSGISNTPTFVDSVTISSNIVTLVNDLLNPGNSKYYGTNSSGVRGFFDVTTDVNTIGTLDSATPSADGAVISTNSLVFQSASVTVPGMVNNTTQSFSGNKTFSGTVGASNLSGTNTGDVSIGTADGLSLAGQVLSLALSSTSTTGALSSTDWNTFNGKQASGNYITALSGDVVASGPGSAASTIQAGVVDNGKVSATAAIDFSKLAPLASANILVGSVANVATSTAVTGDVTISNAGVTAIGTNKVANSQLAPMSANSIKGNNTGSPANASDLTVAQVNTLIGDLLADGSVALSSNWNAGAHSITANSVAVGSAANTISALSTIVNTGTLTLPTSTDTLLGRATSDTLTNKTMHSPDGSAAAPSFAFASDSSNYGMYYATGILAFTTNGTRAAYLDSAQAFHLPLGNLNLGAASNQIVIQPGDIGNEFIFTASLPGQNTTITIPDPGTLTTNMVLSNSTDTLTNKSISGSTNTLSNIGDGSLTTSYVKADGTRTLSADWNAGAHAITANSIVLGIGANTIGGLSTITNGGTLTLPTATDTLVARATTDTLTNKVLTGNTAVNLVSGSGTLTLNTTGTVTLPNATDTLVGKATTDTLTNKTLTGNTAVNLVSGSGTLTLNTTGTVTLPNATDTLVGKATSDTLTNKTLTAPVISTISNSGTITIPTGTDTLVGKATTDILTNKTLGSTNTFTGISATFTTTGGTPATLNFYETGTFTANFNAGAGVSGSGTSGTVIFHRIGSVVTLQFPSYAAMTAGATATTFATAASTIPSRISPVTNSPLFPVFVKKAGTVQTTPGILTINTDGSISIGVVAGFGTNWTSGDVNNGFFQTCVTYTTQ